jgi:hypothetical protein
LSLTKNHAVREKEKIKLKIIKTENKIKKYAPPR